MPAEREIEAAAEALWLDASKRGFGWYNGLDAKWKELWRASAKAALEAAEKARE